VLPRHDKRGEVSLCSWQSLFRQMMYYTAVFFVIISTSPVFSQEKDPSIQSSGVIGFYQKYISPVDGQRCTMYPSCSHYIRQSIQKHGLLKGWIMATDRLVRDGRDEVKLSPPIWIGGKKYTYDPVENNDFWWYGK